MSKFKERMSILHKYHNKLFNEFMDAVEPFVADNNDKDDNSMLLKWTNEYESELNGLRSILNDMEHSIKENELDLTPEMKKNKQINKEIYNTFVPMSIMYWLMRISPEID